MNLRELAARERQKRDLVERTVQVPIRMPEELKARLDHAAEEHGLSRAAIILEAIREFLK